MKTMSHRFILGGTLIQFRQVHVISQLVLEGVAHCTTAHCRLYKVETSIFVSPLLEFFIGRLVKEYLKN